MYLSKKDISFKTRTKSINQVVSEKEPFQCPYLFLFLIENHLKIAKKHDFISIENEICYSFDVKEYNYYKKNSLKTRSMIKRPLNTSE